MSALERESAVTISPFLIRSAMAGSLPPDIPDHAAEPARRHGLLLRVELHGLAPLDMEVPEEGGVPPGEREHRHRGGDADVDPHHPRLDPVLELAGRGPRRRENGGPVPVRGAVRRLYRGAEVLHPHDVEDRPED